MSCKKKGGANILHGINMVKEKDTRVCTDQSMIRLDSLLTRRGREHRSSERQHTPAPNTSGTAAETCRDHEADLDDKNTHKYEYEYKKSIA